MLTTHIIGKTDTDQLPVHSLQALLLLLPLVHSNAHNAQMVTKLTILLVLVPVLLALQTLFLAQFQVEFSPSLVLLDILPIKLLIAQHVLLAHQTVNHVDKP